MASSGARLRKTFKYPSDSEGSGDGRDELDEEEQERLISTLHQQNTQQDALYTLIFTLLPLFLTIPFISSFLLSPLLSILGITSLLITTGRMRFSSPAAASPPKTARQPTNEGVLRYVHLTDLEHRLLDAMPDNGPLRTALPWLNGSICVVLALAAVVLYRRAGRAAEAGGLWVLCLLPGIAWLMVEVAIRSMRDVEKGVGELEKLRYRYKGA